MKTAPAVSCPGIFCIALLGCSSSTTPGAFARLDGGSDGSIGPSSDAVLSDVSAMDTTLEGSAPPDSGAPIPNLPDASGEAASTLEADVRTPALGLLDAGTLDHVATVSIDALVRRGIAFTPPVLSPDIEVGNPGVLEG